MAQLWHYSPALPHDMLVELALMQNIQRRERMQLSSPSSSSNFVVRGFSGVIISPLHSLILHPCPSFFLHILYRFCAKSFPSELNPQSGPLLEPLSCWSALTLTPLFISGTQLSPSQVEESQRERQECKLVSQISTSTLINSSLPCSTHFLSRLLSDAFWNEENIYICLPGNQSRYNIVQLLASKACLKFFSCNWKRFTAREICCFGYIDGWSKTLPHLFFDVISNTEHLFIRAARASMYWLYYMIDEFVSFWALLRQISFILTDFYNHLILRAISCFFLQSWRSWFKCWVHVLHMCGLLAWGTHPRTSDTRVQAEMVVWCKVEEQCPDWPLGTVHIQTMPS